MEGGLSRGCVGSRGWGTIGRVSDVGNRRAEIYPADDSLISVSVDECDGVCCCECDESDYEDTYVDDELHLDLFF